MQPFLGDIVGGTAHSLDCTNQGTFKEAVLGYLEKSAASTPSRAQADTPSATPAAPPCAVVTKKASSPPVAP